MTMTYCTLPEFAKDPWYFFRQEPGVFFDGEEIRESVVQNGVRWPCVAVSLAGVAMTFVSYRKNKYVAMGAVCLSALSGYFIRYEKHRCTYKNAHITGVDAYFDPLIKEVLALYVHRAGLIGKMVHNCKASTCQEAEAQINTVVELLDGEWKRLEEVPKGDLDLPRVVLLETWAQLLIECDMETNSSGNGKLSGYVKQRMGVLKRAAEIFLKGHAAVTEGAKTYVRYSLEGGKIKVVLPEVEGL